MRARTIALFATLLAAGCGSDAINNGGDAGVDAAVSPDLASSPDLLVLHSGIGDPCTDTCTDPNQSCIPDSSGFSGGYCTAQCDPNNPCPTDSSCITLQGTSLCLLDCTTSSQCRSNYHCSMKNHVCVPNFGGGNGGGVTPGTRSDGTACVQPVVNPDNTNRGAWSANVPSGSTMLDAETELWADPTGQTVVVAYNHDLAGGAGPVGAVYSTDGGKTWSANVDVKDTQMTVVKTSVASDPVVARDSQGTFFVSWVGYDYAMNNPNPINMNVYVAASTDGGKTYTQFSQVTPDGEWFTMGFLDKPWIYVSPKDDSVWATWDRQNSSGSVSIRLARSTDHGKTWSTPIDVSDTAQRPMSDRNLAQPSVAADGTAVITWVEIPQGGAQFGSTANAIYAQRFNADGTKNGANVQVSAGADSPTFEDPSVAISGSNVYVGFISGTTKGDWDVRVAASLDGGATFGPSVKVNDDPTCATHFHHQIFTDKNGNVHAIWYDNRYLTGNVFYAMSPPATSNTPLQFGKNVFVNDQPFTFTTRRDMANWLGDYLGLMASDGTLHASWTDNRINNSSRIFYASMPLQ